VSILIYKHILKMTKVLTTGVSPFDLRRGKVPAGSYSVRLNYANKNTENIITKHPVVAFGKNGRYASTPAKSIPRMETTELKANIPTQKWISDAANILKPKEPVLNSIGVQTEDVGTTPMTPVLPSGVRNIPVSSQGVPISIQTDMWQPVDPSPRVDASVQTWSTCALEPSSQIINNNYYNQVTPVTNTTNQQFVNNQVDQSVTNQQVVNNMYQTENNLYQTSVQQELMHLVDNRLQLLVHQNNLQQNLSIVTDPSLTRPRPTPQAFQPGTQIVMDQAALMDVDVSQAQIEYPSSWVASQTNPVSVEEPVTPSKSMVPSFGSPRPVPNRIMKRKRKKLRNITNTPR
jgi:hypothetical protein